MKNNMITNKRIFRYILESVSPYKKELILAIFSIFCVSGSILLLGKVIKSLIDQAITTHNANNLNHEIIILTCLILVLGISSFTRSYSINSLSERVLKDIRSKIYNHLLTLEFRQFELLKESDIVSRMFSDIELISRLIIDLLSFCIRNSFIFIGGICLMFMESIKLTLITLAIVPTIVISLTSIAKNVRALSRNTQSNLAILSEYVNETFRGVKTVYSSNAQEYKKDGFTNHLDTAIQVSLKRLKLRAIFFASVITAIMCAITFVIWVGSHDVLNNQMSAGELVSFIIYSAYSGISIGSIFEIFGEMQRCLAGAERVFSTLEINDIELKENKQLSLAPSFESIEFKNIHFFYPSRPSIQVLNNISFSIHKGEFIGIVGPSGSGKSTLAQLLLKFFNTYEGDILFNAQSLSKIPNDIIRQNIAYVPQDPFLFSDSIKNNLLLLTPNKHEMNDIMSIVELDKLLSTLPDGLDTHIGTAGTQISGGQRQRIAIARALIRKPNILLLDEATSALDHESEKHVLHNIRNKIKNSTIISIAHRISSLEKADRIFVMDSGTIIAQGSHDFLLKTCDLYQRLCNEDPL